MTKEASNTRAPEGGPTSTSGGREFFALRRLIQRLAEPGADPPRPIRHYHRAVLGELLVLSDNVTRAVTVGQETLHKNLDVCESKVRSVLRDLEAWGYIRRERRSQRIGAHVGCRGRDHIELLVDGWAARTVPDETLDSRSERSDNRQEVALVDEDNRQEMAVVGGGQPPGDGARSTPSLLSSPSLSAPRESFEVEGQEQQRGRKERGHRHGLVLVGGGPDPVEALIAAVVARQVAQRKANASFRAIDRDAAFTRTVRLEDVTPRVTEFVAARDPIPPDIDAAALLAEFDAWEAAGAVPTDSTPIVDPRLRFAVDAQGYLGDDPIRDPVHVDLDELDARYFACFGRHLGDAGDLAEAVQ